MFTVDPEYVLYDFSLKPRDVFEYGWVGTIFNLTGQVIKTGVLAPISANILDVSTFREGFYFIEVFNESRNLLSSQKFVVMK